MILMRLQITKHPLNYFRLVSYITKKHNCFPSAVCYYATTVEIDSFIYDNFERHRTKQVNNKLDINISSIRHFMDRGNIVKDVSKMDNNELNELIQELISKNKSGQIERLLAECSNIRKFIGDPLLKRLFSHYSRSGKPDMIEIIQKYCFKLHPNLYRRNGKFMHYLAIAQCFRGNSDKGLSILKNSYKVNESLRSHYRVVFRELIQDTVLNRSEASLVIFKKYVLEFSKDWKEHYPLICFWHVLWSSNWFSDQMLADELLEANETLKEVIRERATAFSINILREDFNDDAVMRLLQSLLKYKMMVEYAKVLEVLFSFKLRNRDLRGCTEIIRNCEVLGISLPSYQQGSYIKMLIHGKAAADKPTDKTTKNFTLKF